MQKTNGEGSPHKIIKLICAVVQFGFTELELNRIHAHHLTRNPGSGKVLQKISMRHEGSLRDHIRKWGKFEDIEMYGILKHEYQS